MRVIVVLFAACLIACPPVQADELPDFNRDPAQARIVTEDLERFWTAWDRAAEAPEERRAIFQQEYLDKGTAGLDAFLALRIGDVDKLLAAMDAAPRYYASLREQMDHARAAAEAVQPALHKLDELLPDAVFPDTYLVIGALNSAGTLDEHGLLIGFEMNGKGEDTPMDELSDWHRSVIGTPDSLPTIIVHELIHFQQAVHGRLNFESLLGQSIAEGAADFMSELLVGGNINSHVHEWAIPREAELWAEFQTVMHGSDPEGWLYGGAADTGRPADLGYFIGYRITEAYYKAADDKAAAIQDIVSMKDPESFLARSGYNPAMEE